ncbi:MAG: hypothetical protein L0Z62_35110 [Gemmataceae bacterium]|nr:hypothetical protein [Gemmataceae bacterium]
MAVIFGLTLIGSVGLLGLAVWPGILEDAVFSIPFICLSGPLLAGWFFLLITLAVLDLARKPDPARKRRWGLGSAGVMFATLGLLWLRVPQRVIFAFHASELRGLVDTAPGDGFQGQDTGRQVGLYRIDCSRADHRGGVYFRTHTGPDGIGPDTMSYGFAFRANGQGTPFGNAYYRYRWLFGDWYVFAASNDW